MAGTPRANWLAIRTYYLAGHTYGECADKFGITKRQIERVASAEKWVQAKQRVAETAVEQFEDKYAQATAQQLFDSHVAYANRLMAMALDAEEDLRAIPPGRSRIEGRRAAIEAAERAVKLAREVRGLKIGQASDPDEEEHDSRLVIEQVRLEPVKVPVDEQGRGVA